MRDASTRLKAASRAAIAAMLLAACALGGCASTGGPASGAVAMAGGGGGAPPPPNNPPAPPPRGRPPLAGRPPPPGETAGPPWPPWNRLIRRWRLPLGRGTLWTNRRPDPWLAQFAGPKRRKSGFSGHRLEHDPRFLRRIEQARNSLRAGRGM